MIPIQNKPIVDVSVVMGVYNGSAHLQETLDSVLTQTGVLLEFIVVDDGSTDETPEILRKAAVTDSRVRVYRQENAGLTRALISGCAAARAPIIARQDAGDRSLPDRLSTLLGVFSEKPDAVMAATATRYVTQRGEFLQVQGQAEGALHAALGETASGCVRGPSHHGAVAFRREAYNQVGGYRRSFRVAQDLDLWMRLREVGYCVSMQQVGYEAQLAPSSISFRRKPEQEAAMDAILLASAMRRAGTSDADAIAAYEAAYRDSQPRIVADSKNYAAYCYFVAGLLAGHNVHAARRYVGEALAIRPYDLPTLYRYLRLAFVPSRAPEPD